MVLVLAPGLTDIRFESNMSVVCLFLLPTAGGSVVMNELMTTFQNKHKQNTFLNLLKCVQG